MDSKQTFWRFDKWMEKHLGLWAVLLVVLLVRLPSLLEPVWYLDETIYLTIGNALNHGAVLYKDIVDHKTPLIYYLARVANQTEFRLLLIGWMLMSSACLYYIVLKATRSRLAAVAAALALGVLAAWPKMEGQIPNGELFVMGFVLLGVVALTKSDVFRFVFGSTSEKAAASQPRTHSLTTAVGDFKARSLWWVWLSGCLLACGVLTKVPAIFDVGGVLFLVYVSWWLHQRPRFLTRATGYIKQFWPELLWLCLGLLTPVVLSVVYFGLKGALPDYLQFGLLYNFRYAGSWVLDLPRLLLPLFTLPGKVALLLVGILGLTLLRKLLHPLMFWAAGWTLMALVATTLSNRPYPHYFLQLVLPLSLSVGALVAAIRHRTQKKRSLGILTNTAIFAVLVGLCITTWQVLHVWYYPTVAYYSKAFQLVSGQLTSQQYAESFSPLVADNYRTASVLKSRGLDTLYIWGTNPSLYVIHRSYPADKFTVLFHVEDLDVIDQTVQNVISAKPDAIVVMRDAAPPPASFMSFLHNYYKPLAKTKSFDIWQNRQAGLSNNQVE